MTFGVRALAALDSNDATDTLPRVIPYEGVLDLDGSPYTGFLDFKFTLYDAPSGGNAVWTETWNQGANRAVQVYAGRFAANLGSFDDGGLRSLSDVIADADPVYLGVEVKHTDDADDSWVALNGRQRLNPVPYALWSNKASSLDVAGNATVAGTLNVAGSSTLSGTVTAGSIESGGHLQASGFLSIGGDANISGTLNARGSTLTLGLGDGQSQGNSQNQRALYHGGNDTLYVNYGGDFEGGTTVQSALTTTGAVTSGGDLTVNGAVTFTGNVSDSNGDVVINDGLDVKNDTDFQSYIWSSTGDLNIHDAVTTTGNVTVGNNLSADSNSWGDCQWQGATTGTSHNGETLEGYCDNGRYVAGIRRWHGNFDYGIETLTLYCCKL